ncbi:hypothetical protein OQ252_11410 [Acetobacter farinalis]|uniref:Uncharacterized protein n=1 Tax=Acetobacter farinalis TaxID=1260984 RepID=A0ABT3Q9N9_9PROT|nr:hypothetical protein [Acetobacter farinalis]MCX2561998.1 hypothetical protein [Acetobacter farinalis]
MTPRSSLWFSGTLALFPSCHTVFRIRGLLLASPSSFPHAG